jgi:hypothetical protein
MHFELGICLTAHNQITQCFIKNIKKLHESSEYCDMVAMNNLSGLALIFRLRFH